MGMCTSQWSALGGGRKGTDTMGTPVAAVTSLARWRVGVVRVAHELEPILAVTEPSDCARRCMIGDTSGAIRGAPAIGASVARRDVDRSTPEQRFGDSRRDREAGGNQSVFWNTMERCSYPSAS